jgi:hypothetical protein
MTRFRGVALIFVLVALAVPVGAHHSFSAEYDANKPVKLTGKVIEMKWSNPHAWIYVEVKGKDGKAVKRGWRREDLVAGTQLVVDGYQARNGTPTANATSITFTDGRKLFAGSSQGSTTGGK